MDNYATTVELVDALAWPAAAVTVVILLRRQLGGLLDRVRKVSVKGVTADLVDATHSLEVARMAPMTKASRLAESDPAAAIDEAWHMLWAAVAKRMAGHPEFDGLTPLRRTVSALEELARTGAISPNYAEGAEALFDAFRRSHTGEVEVTSSEALLYIRNVSDVILAVEDSTP